MKKNSKSIITLWIFLLLGSLQIDAQIDETRSTIISEHGNNYTVGVADNGTKYIRYDKELDFGSAGKYIQTKNFYFRKLEDGSERCYSYMIIEPSSELNAWIAHFRKKKYVEISETSWKDYERNHYYKVTAINGFCRIICMTDKNK